VCQDNCILLLTKAIYLIDKFLFFLSIIIIITFLNKKNYDDDEGVLILLKKKCEKNCKISY